MKEILITSSVLILVLLALRWAFRSRITRRAQYALWTLVLVRGKGQLVRAIPPGEGRFLVLSGLSTGASWLCYYRALQLGRASQVVSIDKLSVVITLVLAFVFLHEPFTAKSMVGCALVAAGTLFMVL